MNIKKMPKRVKEALKQIDYSKLYDYYNGKDFVELVLSRYGDTCTYRVYDNGDICEQ